MIEYLQSPERSVWDLADEGDAFVWADDRSTIALAAELAAVLSPLRMSLDGLPSLTTTLFVIAALRSPTATDNETAIETWATRLKPIGGRSIQCTSVAKWLVGLSQLPADLRSGIEGPIAVLGGGLENCRRFLIEVDINASDEIIEVLELPGEVRELGVDNSSRSRQSPRIKRAWETLLYLSRTGLDAEGLRTWKSTGLVTLPTPAEDVEPPPPRDPINRLLSDLIEDEEFGKLAQLSRTTASLLTLPRRPSDPDVLPIGGVSDVTNRGNPERLLMTELAADPMLLLARIANGQALYLRRETPPGPTPDRRPVAIESGIRCWGDTRVRLAALALAIAASEERRGETVVDFSVVHDEQFVEQNFSDRDGLISHLETLEPSVHPGHAIARWFEELRNPSNEEESILSEPMILMSADSDADPEFRESIRDVPRPFLIATIDREGAVQIARRTILGDEVLQRLTLELPQVRKSKEVSAYGIQPLFLSQNPSPVSFNVDHQTTWCASDVDTDTRRCLWIVTKDSRLLLARSTHHGVTEVIRDLPHHRVIAHQADLGRLDLIVGSEQGVHHYVSVERNTWSVRRLKLPEDFRPTHTCIVGGMILRFSDNGHQEIPTISNRPHTDRFSQLNLVGPGMAIDDTNRLMKHGGARRGDWHSVLKPGSSIIEPIQCVVLNAQKKPCMVATDLSYLVELGEDEKTIYTNSIVYADSPPTPVLCDVSGQNWIVRCDNVRQAIKVENYHPGVQYFRINTSVGRVTAVVGSEYLNLLAAVDSEAANLVTQKPVRKKFQSAQMTTNGLVLRSSARSAHRLSLSAQPPWHLVLDRTSIDPSTDMIPFDPSTTRSNPKHSWNVRPAAVRGGTVWLDSRGLIHLQRDDDPRELTLILVDKHVAGWFSETGYFGPPFFAPLDKTATVQRSGNIEINWKEFGNHSTVNVPSQVTQWLDQWSERS